MTKDAGSTGPAHISKEKIAAFLEHSLSWQETEDITLHLADCAQCRFKVALSAESRGSVGDRKEGPQ